MARTVITLTSAWQQVATAACVLRVRDVPATHRTLSLNETADDATAMKDSVSPGDQYAQTETKETYAKGAGITITVDTAG